MVKKLLFLVWLPCARGGVGVKLVCECGGVGVEVISVMELV